MSVNIALTNYNAQMAYSKMSAFVNTFTKTISSESTSYEGITDSIKLSPQSLQAFSHCWITGQLDAVTSLTEEGEYKTTDAISKEYAEDLAGFATSVTDVFSKKRISLDNNVTLQSDGLGHIRQVEELNPMKEEIAEALKETPKLTSDFMLAAARESIMNATRENPEFINEYVGNPESTLEKYEQELKESMLGFQVTVSKRGVNTGFSTPLYR